MSVLFVIALITKNNAVADVGYGGAFMVLTATAVLSTQEHSWYVLLLSCLPFVWGTRLALRIYLKNKGKPEDFRYRAWRESWGKTFIVRSYLQIYILQGIIAFAVALPILLAIVYPAAATHTPIFLIGIALWLMGFIFETTADFQLDTFIKNPENKGKIMMSGLWQYSRHPNYFGESLMWWGIAVAAFGISAVPSIGFVSPILITFLLLFVSGVPLLEKRWVGNPEWEAYKARTSVFFPLPIKKI